MKSNKTFLTHAVVLLALAVLMAVLSCSSDLFNPSKKSEEKNVVINSLEFDAYEVNPGDTVTAIVSVNDAQSQTLQYEWAADGGSFIPPLNKPQVLWKAPIVGGTYRISVTVSNGEKSASHSEKLTVKSLVNPSVKIVSPANGGYFVKYDTLTVNARASHDNGIEQVDLYINRNHKTVLSPTSLKDGYACAWRLDEPSGPALVTVEAVSVTNIVGKDSVTIFIEGIVLGKTRR